jgi:hypothetical protein
VGCRGTRVIWKSLDWLKPSLQLMQSAVHRNDACNRCHVLRRYAEIADATSGMWSAASEGGQGDERASYVTLDTYGRDERGIA